jgi:flagellar basal-body rod modification protein FlgD
VRTVVVEADAKGEQRFAWDGLDASGQRLPPGSYAVAARHVDAGGTANELDTYVDAVVESVTIGTDGLYLNLPGLGTAPLDYVLRIGKSA